MTPRTGALLVLAAAALVAPGGRSASAADAVATVNGEEISADDFERTLEELGATATVTGDQARAVLTELIVNEAMRQALRAQGVDPDADATGDAETAQIQRDRDRYAALLVEAGLVDGAGLEAEYEDSGVAGGVLCAVVMLADDEEAADAALADLEDVDDVAGFTAVADDRGLFLGTVGSDASSPCSPASSLPPEIVEPLVAAFEDAGVGVATGPLDIGGDLVIAIAPPFDEVSATLLAPVVEASTTEILSGVEVSIAPRYGRWDPESNQVVPLGQP